jgi:Alpha-kinase family
MTHNLETLEEESDDNDESEDNESEDDKSDSVPGNGRFAKPPPEIFELSIVAQVFSHFTYVSSERTRLVCDLQGIFDHENNILLLSDPAVHSYFSNHPDQKRMYGETDCG